MVTLLTGELTVSVGGCVHASPQCEASAFIQSASRGTDV